MKTRAELILEIAMHMSEPSDYEISEQAKELMSFPDKVYVSNDEAIVNIKLRRAAWLYDTWRKTYGMAKKNKASRQWRPAFESESSNPYPNQSRKPDRV